jgi:transcriptional regulator with XRE-family HTH domain
MAAPHIGKLIGKLLKDQSITNASLAKKLGLKSPKSITEYLRRPSLQADIIWKISEVLHRNIFREFANEMDIQMPPHNSYTTDQKLIEKDNRIAELEKELSIYKEIVGVGRR